MRFVFHPSEQKSSAQLGGKAGALAELHGADLNIPPWFVVLPEACEVSLAPAGRDLPVRSEDTAWALHVFEGLSLAAEVKEELGRALRGLFQPGEMVAVRSSAIEEDGRTHSFAGQFSSFLSVPQEKVEEKIVAVWRSAFTARARAYRRLNGLGEAFRPPAVLIQRMVAAETAGVAFGVDPVSGCRETVVVTAVRGLGVSLVNGDASGDTWHIHRHDGIVQRKLAEHHPVLNDAQVRAVAALARRMGDIFGRPQDIEWAMVGGVLHLLQCRPITAGPASEPLVIWDNSNIVESYSGVTTPLTFSFARRAYKGVYQQFCRILCVPRAKIRAHNRTFANMLGLVRGRIYYNLLNWYRVLALLPGFTLNRRFMEQMMGVKEELPAEILAELGKASLRARAWDALNLAISAGALMANHFLLPSKIRRFYRRLDDALAPTGRPLEAMKAEELRDHFFLLEKKLLTRWDAPLLNDFFAMIYFGVLGALIRQWIGKDAAALQTALLCGNEGMISAEPAIRIRELAQLAAKDPRFARRLRDAAVPEVLQRLDELPQFAAGYRAYMARFGERCLEELKLETLTLHDDPGMLLRSIGRLAQGLEREPVGKTAVKEQQKEARRGVNDALAGRLLRGAVFAFVLRQTRVRVRQRENMRFERTRVYGRVRRIMVELGSRLFDQGGLREPRDIFYLELDEVFELVRDIGAAHDLGKRIASRKAEFAQFRTEEPPPNRFTTRGTAVGVRVYPTVERQPGAVSDDLRRGMGSCPGVVRGLVRRVHDPRSEVLRPGEILVAERTDPGWVMLFGSIAGLLVERGSLLSHSAIVAREMGIPAVVGIDGLMQWLRDGDLVEFDGASGEVRRLEAAAVQPPRAAAVERGHTTTAAGLRA